MLVSLSNNFFEIGIVIPKSVSSYLMVDFNKAFNRLDHNILITKLADMNVPSWLLKLVMAFLTDRKMIVRYKGMKSNTKDLPAGSPQGTLLGLLLFLVMINDAGFEIQNNNAGELLTCKRNLKEANRIHLKYVDDMTLAKSINLTEKLVSVPSADRQLPDSFHARTGHILPKQNSQLYSQLLETESFANRNHMKINFKKTNLMLFNPCTSLDFMPDIQLDGHQLELVDQMRLLGVVIQSDL